jgi:uncharacterized membrane protein
MKGRMIIALLGFAAFAAFIYTLFKRYGAFEVFAFSFIIFSVIALFLFTMRVKNGS